jgi:hypothetical protein
MACFLLLTAPPLPPFPERSLPLFSRCIALLTLLLAAFPYSAMFLFPSTFVCPSRPVGVTGLEAATIRALPPLPCLGRGFEVYAVGDLAKELIGVAFLFFYRFKDEYVFWQT